MNKCIFGVEEINFVGHRISSAGVDPGKCKVEAIAEAIAPQTVSELKSFLGSASYCSKFIPDFSSRTDVLRQLSLGKTGSSPIKLNNTELLGFEPLKQSLAEAKT